MKLKRIHLQDLPALTLSPTTPLLTRKDSQLWVVTLSSPLTTAGSSTDPETLTAQVAGVPVTLVSFSGHIESGTLGNYRLFLLDSPESDEPGKPRGKGKKGKPGLAAMTEDELFAA